VKKTEFKKVLKPLIKECIKEVIFEEGILSGIISEVAQGLGTRVIAEQQVQTVAPPKENIEEALQRQQESRQKMLDAIGNSTRYKGVNIFENTEPLRTTGDPTTPSAPSSPMSNIAPDDAGVDISGILNVSRNDWKQLI